MPDIRFFGGLNQRSDTDVHLFEATDGKNFRLDNKTTTLKPRFPITYIHKAGSGASNNVNGILQLIKQDDSQTQIVITNAGGGTVYTWDLGTTLTTTGFTTAGSGRKRAVYWALDDKLIVLDAGWQADIATWDGTTYATMTTGLTNLRAKFGVEHNGRLWLFNVKETTTEYPHVILASEFENENNFNLTNQGTSQSPTTSFADSSDPFFLVTPDLREINGVVSHLGSLIISTVNGSLFRLTGSDASDYNFIEYYARSGSGGNPSYDTMASIGNDVVYVRSGPVIELLSTTEKFGDTSTDDLSAYIPVEMTRVGQNFETSSHILYDFNRQLVYFFAWHNLSEEPRVLVLDKSKLFSELSPWTRIHSDLVTFNNSNVEFATPVMLRTATSGGSYEPYFGYGERLFKLVGTEGDADTDDTAESPSTANIVTNRTTKLLRDQEAPRMPIRGSVEYQRQDAVDLDITLDMYPDQYQSTITVPLDAKVTGAGSPSVTNQYDLKRFNPAGRGLQVQVKFEIDDADKFDIGSVKI